MKAVVLAGGFGTRLSSVVSDVPKPMAQVLERPFLTWIFDQLESQGISEVILAVHHKHEIIKNFFGDKYSSLQIKYAIEETPLGTGGAILNALGDVPLDEPCFVLNGDSYLDISLEDMNQVFFKHDMVIALRKIENCARYGQAVLKDGKLTHFKYPGGNNPGWINAGIYLLTRRLFEVLSLEGSFSFETDVLEKNLEKISCIVVPSEGKFIDIGVPESYAAAPNFFKNIRENKLI